MNKWMALVIGLLVLFSGAIVGSQLKEPLGLIITFFSLLLTLTVFVLFLRKHTGVLALGVGIIVLIVLANAILGIFLSSHHSKLVHDQYQSGSKNDVETAK